MIYVRDTLASEIKREPTKEEQQIVAASYRRQNELYSKYNRLYKVLDKPLMERLWNEYLKELKRYNSLFDKYMGYCY